MRRRGIGAAAAVAVVLPVTLSLTTTPSSAAPKPAAAVDPDVWRLPTELAALGSVAPALTGAKGTVDVTVQLSQQPVAAVVERNAVRGGTLPSAAAQRARTAKVRQQQGTFASAARKLGATVGPRTALSANVVVLRVQASRVAALAKLPGVVRVAPLGRYTTDETPASDVGTLAEAVRYVRADRVRSRGIDGTGVKVAVLDSGIDYTHRNLGGPGTVEAYKTCYQGDDGKAHDKAPVGLCATLFGPTAPKVKGGYDFVGEEWTGAAGGPAEKPDPNPIDLEGHGTHVADAIAGRSADGKHTGIAPGADLYGVRVCSAISTACSGTAILQGLEWVLDPNGDGIITDAMDVANMSLGQAFGLSEDDASVAVNNVVNAGVVVVISAGNNADRPFIVGSASTAENAISVAQTALPGDKIYPITVDSPSIAGLPGNTVRYAVAQPWAPAPTTTISGNLAAPSDPGTLGCTPADFADFPKGAIAFIKRGTCNATVKADNAQKAGAIAVIIWNNVPGDPPTFSSGGGDPITIPTLTISFERGTLLAKALAAGPVAVTLDPAKAISLRNTTVGTSSRGPRIEDATVKPDIGAPGAWFSAEAGTGAEETAFGGTSGAAPIVSGVAALVLQAHPGIEPLQVKARLLNGADTGNTTLDVDANAYPTPVSRIGAGEVRADTAVFHTGLLENPEQANGNVGLGLLHLARPVTRRVTLTLTNTSGRTKTYSLSASFREQADEALGALTVRHPARVTVRAGRTVAVPVTFTIDPAKLPQWPFTQTAGSTGAGSTLNAPELDGFITARSGSERLHLGWHVLPHRSADVRVPGQVRLGPDDKGTITLVNRSTVQDGTVDVFGLTGTSGRLPASAPGGPGTPGSNTAVVDLAAVGVRDDAENVQFAIATQDRNRIPTYPAEFDVDIDTDKDGKADYLVYNSELGAAGSTAQSVVNVRKLATNTTTVVGYVITDFDNAVQVFTVPLSALGLTKGASFDFDVRAGDNYFSGLVSDRIEGMSWTVGGAQFSTTPGPTFTVPAGRAARVTVTADPSKGGTSESGLLLVLRDNVARDFAVVDVE
jgi:subtilisin family serine protease